MSNYNRNVDLLSSGGWSPVSRILKWVTRGTFGIFPSAVTVFIWSVDVKSMVLKCVNVSLSNLSATTREFWKTLQYQDNSKKVSKRQKFCTFWKKMGHSGQ